MGAAFEGFDNDHGSAATGAWVGERLCIVVVGDGIRLLVLLWRVEQLARPGQVLGATAVCEQPIVSDAVEAVRQDVDQETADELVRREGLYRSRPLAR